MIDKEKYHKNINIIKTTQPHLFNELEKIDIEKTENYQVVPTKNNSYTLQIKKNDQYYYLHSRYDPQKESNLLIDKVINDNYDIIFCGGFGLGFFINSLFQIEKYSFTKLIVIENDLTILKLALHLFDYSNLLNSEKIKILYEHDNDVAELNDILIRSVTKKVYTFIPQAYLKISPDFYKNLKNLIDSYLSRKSINIATLTRFQKLWSRNIIKNHKIFLKHKGIKELYNKYNNSPCLVISAGPSLNNYIDEIRVNQAKFIVIAVDSVFQTLVKNKIFPDIVLTVDPQYINYKYFEYNQHYKPLLIAESSVFPLILSKYKGPKLFFSSVFPLTQWLEKFSSEKGEIDMGGSVSTTAFDFAYRIGCNPIILFGQDLAFTDNRTHTKGSYVEKYWALRNNKFKTSLNGTYNYIHNNLFIQIKSNDNKMVNTDKRLMIFLVWFKNKMKSIDAQKKIYNTALTGANIENMIVQSFSDILNKNKLKDISNIKKEIIQLDSDINNIDYDQFIIEIKNLNSLLDKLNEVTDESLALSEKLYHLIDENKDINSILSKLDHNDKNIHSYCEQANFLGMIIQDKIFSILEEYESYLTEKEKFNEDLKIAKRSIILYSSIKESINLFKRLFQMVK